MKLGRALYLGHQWLGIAAGAVLLVVALSGAALTFAPEMRVVAYRQVVEPREGQVAPVAAFRDTLREAFPQGDFRTITFRGRQRAVEVLLFAPGGHTDLWGAALTVALLGWHHWKGSTAMAAPNA